MSKLREFYNEHYGTIMVVVIIIAALIFIAVLNPRKTLSYPVNIQCCADLCATKHLTCKSFNNEYVNCIEARETCVTGYSMAFSYFVHDGRKTCEWARLNRNATTPYDVMEFDYLNRCLERR
ncbi:MAG: hypothetical protein MUP55_03285 [Candidatus Aenigmarchaeota archaeon]|nr:hypothetical protein [Candidatus Aenigmarchaeota archaeon]